MVDFSIFFVVLRLVIGYTRDQITLNTKTILIVLISVFCICILCAVFMKTTDASKKQSLRRTFLRLANFSGVLLFISIVYLAWPDIIVWTQQYINVTSVQLAAFSVATALSIASFGTLFASRFFPKTPNNNSLCNTRQVYKWAGYLSTIALGMLIMWMSSEDMFNVVVKTFLYVTEIISILLWFYDPFIYILANLFKPHTKPHLKPTPNKINRFAVIGCAHNESSVIGQLVKSVYSTTYPKNKYDIYVICDNCTDNTADVVRKAGAIAMVRNNPDERGKGFGLKWMFNILEEKRQKGDVYDAYIVLDADNLVNEEYFDAINDRMNEGHEMLQTYLGCKNPRDTWISASYSYSYWVSNDLYQNAHSRIGLTCQMGGTGMVIRPSILDDIGWDTDSLTEDLVLTARYTLLRNRSACWVHSARLYDEKPLKNIPSIRQRTRWMQGHMAAMFKFAPKLLYSSIRHLSFRQFDMAFYLLRPFLNLVLLLSYAVRLSINTFAPQSALSMGFIMGDNVSMLLLIGYITLQLYVLFMENYGRYIPVFLVQLVFSFTWYPAIFRGLIKRNERYWVSTVHTRNIAVSDILEDTLLNEAKERLKGLDNLHKLPLGQILLKATAISNVQLNQALSFQKANGGFLGDVIVEQNILDAETLDAYLTLQQTMKDEARREGTDDERLRLGDILLNSGIITQEQLDMALDYQARKGGHLGECLIIMRCMPVHLLQLFLDVQRVLDSNFVSQRNARHLINGVLDNRTKSLGTILFEGGLISQQQLNYALDMQKKQGGQIGSTLVECGFVGEETIDLILKLQAASREFLRNRELEDAHFHPTEVTS